MILLFQFAYYLGIILESVRNMLFLRIKELKNCQD